LRKYILFLNEILAQYSEINYITTISMYFEDRAAVTSTESTYKI